jgi:hypothetical protein
MIYNVSTSLLSSLWFEMRKTSKEIRFGVSGLSMLLALHF